MGAEEPALPSLLLVHLTVRKTGGVFATSRKRRRCRRVLPVPSNLSEAKCGDKRWRVRRKAVFGPFYSCS